MEGKQGATQRRERACRQGARWGATGCAGHRHGWFRPSPEKSAQTERGWEWVAGTSSQASLHTQRSVAAVSRRAAARAAAAVPQGAVHARGAPSTQHTVPERAPMKPRPAATRAAPCPRRDGRHTAQRPDKACRGPAAQCRLVPGCRSAHAGMQGSMRTQACACEMQARCRRACGGERAPPPANNAACEQSRAAYLGRVPPRLWQS